MNPGLVFLFLIAAEPAKVDVKLEEPQKASLAKAYPGQEIIAGCSGAFLGKKTDAVVALYSKEESNIRVVWVGAKGALKDLEVMAQTGDNKSLELLCMPQAEAEAHQQTLAGNKDINNFLKPPKGSGLLCFFTDAISAKCWGVEKNGAIVEVGGWET